MSEAHQGSSRVGCSHECGAKDYRVLLSAAGRRDPEAVDEAVFRVLEACPAGKVVAYGTVAAWLGLSNARRAAAAMRNAPEGIPWWRHVRTDGGLIPELLERAQKHWDTEGTPYGTRGVNKAAFWVPDDREWSELRARTAQIEALVARDVAEESGC